MSNCRTGCRSRDIPAGTTSEIQGAIAATRRQSGRLGCEGPLRKIEEFLDLLDE
jgi:hypothetical protein